MSIYYAHAMPTYGTEREEQELQHIKSNFPNAQVIDPGSYQNNPEKKKDSMEYCFRLIDKCDKLIFSRFMNQITAGVGLEINYALKKGMKVYELVNGKLVQILKEVEYLSREDTVALYWKLTLERLNSRPRLTKRK